MQEEQLLQLLPGLLLPSLNTVFTVCPSNSCEQNSPIVHVYDGHGSSCELAVLDSLHSSPLTFIEVNIQSSCGSVDSSYTAQYNSQFEAVVSGDQSGMLEYWSGPSSGFAFPKSVLFQHKMDTDLYEFVKVHTPSNQL